MSGGSGEKTEKPTAKRKKQARKDGQVARTPELGAWLSMLVVAMAIGPLFRLEAGHVRTMLITHLTAVSHPSTSLAFTLLRSDTLHLILVLAGFGSLVLGVSLLATIAQGGFYLSPKLAKPNPKKLNPVSASTATPTFSAVSMMMIDATFGKMWRTITRQLLTPI